MKISSTLRRFAVALLLSLISAGGLFAEAADATSSSTYELRSPLFVGLSAVKEGTTFKALDFFVNPEFRSDLLSVPATKITFDKYVQDKTIGFSLLGSSLVGLVATSSYDLATFNNPSDTTRAWVLGGTAVSVLLELASLPFLMSATDNFLVTVQTYNKAVQTKP